MVNSDGASHFHEHRDQRTGRSVQPAVNRMGANAELFTNQGGAVAFLQEKLEDLKSEFDRVGPRVGIPSPSLATVFSFSCSWVTLPSVKLIFTLVSITWFSQFHCTIK